MSVRNGDALSRTRRSACGPRPVKQSPRYSAKRNVIRHHHRHPRCRHRYVNDDYVIIGRAVKMRMCD